MYLSTLLKDKEYINYALTYSAMNQITHGENLDILQ